MGVPRTVQLVTAVAMFVLARMLKFRPVTLVKVNWNLPLASRVPDRWGTVRFNL